MAQALVRFEDAQQVTARFQARDRYKDKELALLIANGDSLESAATALGMDPDFAWEIARTPLFTGLVKRLRENRERAVYAENPDEALEAEAESNFYTLRMIRDNAAKDADRIKAALSLNEARPSVRKAKQEEAQIKIVIESGERERLIEGMAKLKGEEREAIEAQFQEITPEEAE